VRLSWKFLWLSLFAALPLAGAGCSGINASQSVSPASFFLPGLLKNDAPARPAGLTPAPSSEIAFAK
jgi:hypothetical protein